VTTTTPADLARFAITSVQSDRSIAKEALIDDARDLARRLVKIADELEKDDTFSLISLSMIEQNDIAVSAMRFRHLNDKANTVEKLVADFGVEADA